MWVEQPWNVHPRKLDREIFEDFQPRKFMNRDTAHHTLYGYLYLNHKPSNLVNVPKVP